jgi:aminopeptidase-like protein
MQHTSGDKMYSWASELFPLNRSLTGRGVRETLAFIKRQVPELQIHEVPSGTQAFDWEVPKEWEIREAFIEDPNGHKVVDFNENNLHVVGYSLPLDKTVSRAELDFYLTSLPDQPKAIPYVTSYYKETSGFCISDEQRQKLGSGPFRLYIDSDLSSGHMTYGEVFIQGETSQEVLLSTYICHPSMGNNELSGPVVAMALIEYLKSLPTRKYSYRILFTVETIGSVYFISRNLDALKRNVVAGWVLTCIGDNRTYSYVPSRQSDSYTNLISRQVLEDLGEPFTEYSWLDRGSDERQYCSPGVDLPIASLMRSKYGEYPEYHTSLDDMSVISPEGLFGGFKLLVNAIEILETNALYEIKLPCEPQLGKRGLYPNTSTKSSGLEVRDQMNVISYLDGKHDLLGIAGICGVSYKYVQTLINKLLEVGIVKVV